MRIYLVGGAVRDKLLGREVTDRDYVVVGASEEQMLEKGFIKVGKDFPVFLHPETKEEYALARKEKKVAPGYTGFNFEWDGVSLEEDLLRRDLTINAIAQDLESEEYIDPHGGLKDIQSKILRHVSDAFKEDPLRVLRVARFSAQLKDFEVAEETLSFMKEIALSGELGYLTGERIWKELEKALASERPRSFFEVLDKTACLNSFFPELACLKNIPQNTKYHPEGDVWIHTMLVLDAAVKLSPDIDIRFAALVHDLGKGLTPKEKLPSHHGHDKAGVPLVETVCSRFRVPNPIKKLALKSTEHHLRIHMSEEMKAKALLKLLKQVEAIRNVEFFEKILLVCKADDFGKLREDYPPAEYLAPIAKALRDLNIAEHLTGVPKEQISDKVYELQIQTIKSLIANIKVPNRAYESGKAKT